MIAQTAEQTCSAKLKERPTEALHQHGLVGYDSFGKKEHFREHLNVVPVLFAFLLPLVLFAIISNIVCFHARYSQPGVVCFIVVCGALVPAIFGTAAMQIDRRRRLATPFRPTWLYFIAACTLLAWVAALVTGEVNYTTNAWRYHMLTNLKFYASVDPQGDSGQALLDAGQLVFTHGSHVDVNRSISFKSVDTYCVAPVVSSENHLGSYDFWATGVNCCGGSSVNASLRGGTVAAGTNFQCGQDVNNTGAGGLRVLDNDQLPFFRLAVEQAKSKYHLTANKPIFVTWVQDPLGEINVFADRALKSYVCGVLLFCGFQFALVVFAITSFA